MSCFINGIKHNKNENYVNCYSNYACYSMLQIIFYDFYVMYHMQTNRHFRINRPEINFSCLKYIENLNKSLLIFFIFSHVSHMLILVLKWIIFAIFWSFLSKICWFPLMYKDRKNAFFCFSCINHMRFSTSENNSFFVFFLKK